VKNSFFNIFPLLFFLSCNQKDGSTFSDTIPVNPSQPVLKSLENSDSSKNKAALSLKEAFKTALLNNPDLAQFKYSLRLFEAEKLQALQLHNPEIDFEVEDVLGSGQRKVVNQAQATLGISQVFELGGKKQARLAKVSAAQKKEILRFQLKKRRVLLKIALQYYDTVFYLHQVGLDRNILKIHKDIRYIFTNKVKAAKLSPLQLDKFDLDFGLKKITWQNHKNSLKQQKAQLAALLGQKEFNYKSMSNCFSIHKKIKPFGQLSAELKNHPSLKLIEADNNLQKRELELAESLLVPDITLKAGIRYYNDERDVGTVVGFSVPIKIFSKGEAQRKKAKILLKLNQYKKPALIMQLFKELKVNYLKFKNLHDQVFEFNDKFIPNAKKNFEKIQEGYQLGKLSYLEVLDSERILNRVHQQFHQVLKEYTRAFIILSFLGQTEPVPAQGAIVKHCLDAKY
jgi:cobalt-zinc-cadmium efflux system outer membrane protein